MDSQKIIVLVALHEELDASLINVPVVYTGVGVSNAAMMTYEAIITHNPSLIINYGSAGSLNPSITGLNVVKSVCQRDANCEPLRQRGLMLGENVLYYHSEDDGVKCGSGNNFVTAPDQWTRDHCDIVDMELWSIAKVCQHLDVKWRSVKWISDNADDAAGMTWEQSLIEGQNKFVEWFKASM